MLRAGKWLFCCPALLLATGGCTTLMREQRQAAMRERAETDRLRIQVERLSERTQGLRTSQEEAYRDIEALRERVEELQRNLTARLSEVDRALQAAEAREARNRREIVDTLSKKIAGLLHSRQPAVQPGQTGYEHVVQPGETLSEIAAAYGVRPSAVIRANNLADPDRLQVGQRLFIPE